MDPLLSSNSAIHEGDATKRETGTEIHENDLSPKTNTWINESKDMLTCTTTKTDDFLGSRFQWRVGAITRKLAKLSELACVKIFLLLLNERDKHAIINSETIRHNTK